MNLQERIVTRATAFTTAALDIARARAGVASKRVDLLKDSFTTLSVASRALNEVARRHASRFVKENSAIAVAAGKDFGALARSTYATLSGRKAPAKSRKARASTRKRSSTKAA